MRMLALAATATLLVACANDAAVERNSVPKEAVEPATARAVADVLMVTTPRYAGVMHPYEFRRGEPVEVHVAVDNAAAGTPVEVIWYGADGRPVATDAQKVTGNDQKLLFRATETTDWRPGRHQVEVKLGEKRADVMPFVVL